MVDLFKKINEWKENEQKSYRIVAFGASNTELMWHSGGRNNWVDFLNMNLRTHIGRNVCVINQGVCGQHTRDLLARIERDVFSFSPEMVIITVGANDGFWGFSYEEYYNNLKNICVQLIERNIQPILQTYYCLFYQDGTENFQTVFENFVRANISLSEELDIPIIDQYSFFEPYYRNNPTQYKKLMLDWLHVNPLGNLIMGMNVSRKFGLPDFEPPADLAEEFKITMDIMGEFHGK